MSIPDHTTTDPSNHWPHETYSNLRRYEDHLRQGHTSLYNRILRLEEICRAYMKWRRLTKQEIARLRVALATSQARCQGLEDACKYAGELMRQAEREQEGDHK